MHCLTAELALKKLNSSCPPVSGGPSLLITSFTLFSSMTLNNSLLNASNLSKIDAKYWVSVQKLPESKLRSSHLQAFVYLKSAHLLIGLRSKFLQFRRNLFESDDVTVNKKQVPTVHQGPQFVASDLGMPVS